MLLDGLVDREAAAVGLGLRARQPKDVLGLAAAARHVPIGRGSESAAERVKVSA